MSPALHGADRTRCSPAATACALGDICGFGGIASDQIPNRKPARLLVRHEPTCCDPTESFRFVLPIFLHVGIIHLALNMAAQCTAGAMIEREMG